VKWLYGEPTALYLRKGLYSKMLTLKSLCPQRPSFPVNGVKVVDELPPEKAKELDSLRKWFMDEAPIFAEKLSPALEILH